MYPEASLNETGRSKGILLLIAQVAVAAVMFAWVRMQSFSVAGCGYTCNYGLLSLAYNAYIWIAVVSLLVSLVGVIVLSSRGNESWLFPGCGIALTVLVGAFALVTIPIATSS